MVLGWHSASSGNKLIPTWKGKFMEVDLALLADAATVDGSGKLNVLGIFDRISATEFPAQHGRMALVLRFSTSIAEAGNHAVEIKLLGPEAQEIVRLDGTMQVGPGDPMTGGGVKVPQVLNLDGLVFESPGLYTFDVRIDGEHHAAVPLQILDMSGPSIQA